MAHLRKSIVCVVYKCVALNWPDCVSNLEYLHLVTLVFASIFAMRRLFLLILRGKLP